MGCCQALFMRNIMKYLKFVYKPFTKQIQKTKVCKKIFILSFPSIFLFKKSIKSPKNSQLKVLFKLYFVFVWISDQNTLLLLKRSKVKPAAAVLDERHDSNIWVNDQNRHSSLPYTVRTSSKSLYNQRVVGNSCDFNAF